MLLISYLAHDTQYLEAVQERLALAKSPPALVVARTAPELVHQAQALPVRLALIDISWPRETWEQLAVSLRSLRPDFPLLALSPTASNQNWWEFADDLLRLDEPLELFHYRLEQRNSAAPVLSTSSAGGGTIGLSSASRTFELPSASRSFDETPSLLATPQFRQFAEIFSGMEETLLTESFVAWAQQACQTSRVVMLLRDPATGHFVCRAQRGLPSALVPHCAFPQTAPLCHWLASTGRILLRDGADAPAFDVLADLDVLQALAAVPVMFDGQLVGILGIGPRLAGRSYSTTELEALFALGGQVATAVDHCHLHTRLRAQQEMTEHMLGVMPTGALVLGADNRIAFVNTTAANLLGKSRAALSGLDMRSLPSPLGDLAYEALIGRQDLPRRELALPILGRPLAISVYPLATTPPSAMLLMEDLSPQKRLEEERDRRTNLEMLTNLVHYLAHELRNPLVALSTFSNLAPTRADDPEFKEFAVSMLQTEIGRVNLILEQLLVLTNHVEMQFRTVELAQIIDRVTGSEEMRAAVVVSVPVTIPNLIADGQRLETALTCMLRTATRLRYMQTPVTMKIAVEDTAVEIRLETPVAPGTTADHFLNPWEQFADRADEDVDLGLATAGYILEQHNGTLNVTVHDNIFVMVCRLPLRPAVAGAQQEGIPDAPQSTRRR